MPARTRLSLLFRGCLVLALLAACTPQPPLPTASPTAPPTASATPSPTPTPTATPLPPLQAVDLGQFGKGQVYEMAWSPDGDMLAVTSATGISLYDAQTWQIVQEIPEGAFTPGHLSYPVFMPDGKSLIVVSSYTGAFWRYDLASRQAFPWFENVSLVPFSAPRFSPDGRAFALLSQVCTPRAEGGEWCTEGLELRDSASGALRYSLEQNDYAQEKLITAYVFSPDSRQLAVASLDNRVQVWNTDTGKLRYVLEHESDVTDVAYSPDGRVLASASADQTVRFWEARSGQSLFVWRGFERSIQQVTYLGDSHKLLVGELYTNHYQVYALNAAQLPAEPLGNPLELGINFSSHAMPKATSTVMAKVSPNGRQMAVLLNHTVQVWDLEAGQLTLRLPGYNSLVGALAFSPDGSLLAVAEYDVHLWQVATHTFTGTLEINSDTIQALAFQPGGKQLAVSSSDRQVQIWDLPSHRMLTALDTSAEAYALAYTPDGRLLAAATWCDVQIWDVASGTRLQKLVHSGYEPSQVVFSADGRQLFLIAYQGRWGWEAATGKALYTAPKALDSYYNQAALSATLGLFWSYYPPSPLNFFDPATGQDLYSFANPQPALLAALSSDGRLLALSDRDATQLLDAASGAPLLTLTDSSNPSRMAISPDARLLAATSFDGVTRLWDISMARARIAQTPRQTATPAPTPAPTPTATPEVVPTLNYAPLALPALPPGALRPENIAQAALLGELGLGQAEVAAWAADGQRLAIGGPPGAYIFEPDAAQPTRFLAAPQMVVLLAFSPDGRLLAGQMSNYLVQIWEVATGRSLYTLENPSCIISNIAFAPNSQVLSVHCGDKVYHWSMVDGQMLSEGPENISWPYASPDGRLIIQVSMTAARLVEAGSLTTIKTFDVPSMAPAVARFSPDGRTLLIWFYRFEVARSGMYYAGQNADSMIQLWDILPDQPPTLRTTLAAGLWVQRPIFQVADFQGLSFTPDSRRVATASGDGQVRLWDLASGALLATLPDGRQIYFSPDGQRLAALGRLVQVWDVSTPSEPVVAWAMPGFNNAISGLEFIQEGQTLAALSNGLFQFWRRTETGLAITPTVVLAPDANAPRLAVSPDGRWLAYSTLDKLVMGANDPQTSAWRTLETFADLYYPTAANALAFSPDGARLAAADPLGRVLLWRVGQPEAAPLIMTSTLLTTDLRFNPAGDKLLGRSTSLAPGSVRLTLWEAQTGALLRSWEAGVYMFAFHPNGVTLAAASVPTGKLQLFDLRTWQIGLEMPGSAYARLVFNPDGSLLLAIDTEKIEVWESASGKLLRTLTGSFTHAAFSPDGKLLALSLSDGRIQYWGLPEK